MRKRTVSKARQEGRSGRRQASEGFVVFKINHRELWPGEYWDGPHHTAAGAKRARTRCLEQAAKREEFIVVHIKEVP